MAYADEASKRNERMIKAIASDPNIPEENKKLAFDYTDFMRAKGLTERSVHRNLYCFATFLKVVGQKDVLKLKKEDVTRAVAAIERTDYSAKTKQSILVVIKTLFKHFLGDDDFYPEQVRWIRTTMKSSNRVLPEDILTEKDVLKMIDVANTPRDRALISLLYDSGIRIGELLEMKTKDVDLNTEPVHIRVNGKTGMRKVPITFSAKYLGMYLELDKDRKGTDPLWNMKGSWSNNNSSLDRSGVVKVLRVAAKKAGIEKRVNPHAFRHARATYYANRLTEQQLKVYFGWTGGSNMASTYVHLSGRDIDNAILMANGLKPIEENDKPVLTERTCSRCQSSNAISAVYCSRCGAALEMSTVMHEDERRAALNESAVDSATYEGRTRTYIDKLAKKRARNKKNGA